LIYDKGGKYLRETEKDNGQKQNGKFYKDA